MLNLKDLHNLYEKYEDDVHAQVENFSVGSHDFDFSKDQAIMGVVNMSTDSWYRESVCMTPDDAIRRAKVLHAQGAHIIDIGAESTLPNAARVSGTSQADILKPILQELSAAGVCTSVETYHADVVKQCLEAGANVINLTGKQSSKAIYEYVAEHQAAIIVCYVQGEHVRNVSDFDMSADPVNDMLEYFQKEIDLATSVGVRKIFVDAGLGFYYKNLKDSGQRIRFQMRTFLETMRMRKLGFPVCHALPHAFECFGEEVRSAEAFFAVLATLGKTDLLRTHEVSKVDAVLKTMRQF